MSDFYYNGTARNHFPIIMQLGVLALLLTGIFSALFMHGDNASPQTAPITAYHVASSTAVAATPVPPLVIDDTKLKAKAIYVYDITTGQTLYSRDADEALPLASITKLMTTLLTYELVSEDKTATVPLSAIMQEGSSGFVTNEALSYNHLSEMALISSSNDAAYALGANVGALLGDRDDTAQFVTGMNIRAEELGLDSMLFYNPTGLDISATEAGAYGSARDVSRLMAYIVTEYPELIAPTTVTATRVYNNAGAYHDIENTNEVVTEIPNLLGSKTGFTDLAGGNLTIAFDAGLHRPIVVTVLGSTYQERFSDVLQLVAAARAAVSEE
ncbi:D-alanyl-D-alanine carboxypeptidase [Candidatus Kaiserbacteria bacterium]|nr:D-alanyl-D-alanine carboxypeptidase [Candidatus Kaiserbacteria bacterium]